MRDEGQIRHIGVIGAGVWGVALAEVAVRATQMPGNNFAVTLWGRDVSRLRHEDGRHLSCDRLKNHVVNSMINVTSNSADLADCDILLYACPAQVMAEVMGQMPVKDGQPIIICAKGIDGNSGQFLSQVLAKIWPKARVAILSGPGFALDVIAGLPAAVTIAATNLDLAMALGMTLSSDSFRVYGCDDVVGVEIGGAVKNVMAIAAGMAGGLKTGESARAALISRAFKEIALFGLSFGAKLDTLTGLSGLGDLVLTATSQTSRNFLFGFKLGCGVEPDVARAGMLVEGIATTDIVCAIARRRKLEMPIAMTVNNIISGVTNISDAVSSLMRRPLTSEGIIR